jgi:hypothetical protein
MNYGGRRALSRCVRQSRNAVQAQDVVRGHSIGGRGENRIPACGMLDQPVSRGQQDRNYSRQRHSRSGPGQGGIQRRTRVLITGGRRNGAAVPRAGRAPPRWRRNGDRGKTKSGTRPQLGQRAEIGANHGCDLKSLAWLAAQEKFAHQHHNTGLDGCGCAATARQLTHLPMCRGGRVVRRSGTEATVDIRLPDPPSIARHSDLLA